MSDTQATPAATLAETITRTQEQAAKAIVNLFETGEVLGHYGAVTLLPGDSGHLTYGRSQTTLGSGNLHKLVQRYCGTEGARFGDRLRDWLPRLADKDTALDQDSRLKNVLRACADDPVMRDVQDRFFDEFYWAPALRAASRLGVRLPLSVCVIYDSFVHGSWTRMRDATEASGRFADTGEKAWIRRYVETRRQWLGTHSNELLQKTVYRMDTFQALMQQELWGLPLPLVVRGREISTVTLAGLPPGCYDGPQPGTRSIAVQSPLLRGLDVRLVQLALSDLGGDVVADGVFGNASQRRIAEYQRREKLPETGVASPELIARLVSQAPG